MWSVRVLQEEERAKIESFIIRPDAISHGFSIFFIDHRSILPNQSWVCHLRKKEGGCTG